MKGLFLISYFFTSAFSLRGLVPGVEVISHRAEQFRKGVDELAAEQQPLFDEIKQWSVEIHRELDQLEKQAKEREELAKQRDLEKQRAVEQEKCKICTIQ